MAAFSIMFFIVFFAYAQIGYLMFGVHVSTVNADDSIKSFLKD